MKADADVMFSIITVCRNAGSTIARTIESVIGQEYDKFEYIVIDGYSSDDTVDIIEKYSDRITYWVSEPDEGLYDAMNKGIAHAKGEYISFINADDWYEKGALGAVADYVKNDLWPLIYGYVTRIVDDHTEGYIGIFEDTDVEALHFGNLYCHQGLFVRRDLFDIVGLYDCRYKILADYEWLLNAHDLGYDPKLLGRTVANFTMGGLSCMEKAKDEQQEIMISHYRNHPCFAGNLERKRGMAEFNFLFKRARDILCEYFDRSKHYYIWGTGDFGQKCFMILQDAGCEVAAFIDSNAHGSTLFEKSIYKFEEINERFICWKDENIMIFIATEKYEEEIRKTLEKYAVSKEYYIGISEIFRFAFTVGKDIIKNVNEDDKICMIGN